MSERQHVFGIEELQTLSCKCPRCGNLIVFSLLTDERWGIPQGCPTCSEPLAQLGSALKEYRDFYRTAIKSGLPIRIHSKPVVSEEI
jgi:hypothetical protein